MKSGTKAMLVLLIFTFFLLLFSLSIGRYEISPKQTLSILLSKILPIHGNFESAQEKIIWLIRLPRVCASILVGAALSVSGAAYQGLFKNPLASPDLLGASAGSGLGAALGILFSLPILAIQFTSFIFGILAVSIVYFISMRFSRNHDSSLVLILTGILIGTLLSSILSYIKYVADPYEKLPSITYWLMGSLSAINSKDVYLSFFPIIIGISILLLLRWKLNLLSFGEEEASALGVNTKVLRGIIIACSTLITASAVSISGLIGWIGLVVPHLARLIVGSNYKVLLPISAILGGTYLLLIDTLARTLTAVEIPLGILTSFVGAPFFFYLLFRIRRGWT